ncbi:hypothetical protein [Nocardioides daeguensis]|uniref:SHOCT domain-containing protein n=1 Tax=Nocardioides daeguensis TaxID=908359 RepID=A0ABP6UUK2_9ACTN|nr:hypothetical protein [Nocardioides daeguensis]MBV6728318.1 hypothetical protein [Nocardioides daeguensis]MCR1773127.1 hypothetical protein [Nocardioides daeguensis]
MMWDDDRYYLGWPGMVLVMVLFWALVGVGVYVGARWLGRDQTSSDPLDIVDERLARGEIDVEEYARLWQAIEDRRSEVRSR